MDPRANLHLGSWVYCTRPGAVAQRKQPKNSLFVAHQQQVITGRGRDTTQHGHEAPTRQHGRHFGPERSLEQYVTKISGTPHSSANDKCQRPPVAWMPRMLKNRGKKLTGHARRDERLARGDFARSKNRRLRGEKLASGTTRATVFGRLPR